MSAKVKYPRAEALKVAKELCDALKMFTVRLVVAGSLRRRKAEVGDVEILYIPQFRTVQDGLFDTRRLDLATHELENLVACSVIRARKNVKGSTMWGPKNKLAVHVASGIPVDFFAATEENWFNYLVCRTGGAENNRQIAVAANDKGWKWNPYGPGFTRDDGCTEVATSEPDVFRMAGLPYREPWERL
jgi:DNA polymerase/3'-5' exonuclease PolX